MPTDRCSHLGGCALSGKPRVSIMEITALCRGCGSMVLATMRRTHPPSHDSHGNNTRLSWCCRAEHESSRAPTGVAPSLPLSLHLFLSTSIVVTCTATGVVPSLPLSLYLVLSTSISLPALQRESRHAVLWIIDVAPPKPNWPNNCLPSI